jgi:hypothetical protein
MRRFGPADRQQPTTLQELIVTGKRSAPKDLAHVGQCPFRGQSRRFRDAHEESDLPLTPDVSLRRSERREGSAAEVQSVERFLDHFQLGGVYGSGVPIAISGCFFTLAWNSPTISKLSPPAGDRRTK